MPPAEQADDLAARHATAPSGTTLVPGALSLTAVCALPVMSTVTVIAGGAGMSRPVARLNVMTRPDIAQWTRENELLLATDYPLPEDPAEVADLIRELDARHVAGLAIKFDVSSPGPDAHVIAVADELGFPLLVIPYDVALDDILSSILSTLTNRQASALSRAREVHEALLKVALAGGLADIVVELSQALDGSSVWCLDAAGQVLASSFDPQHQAELMKQCFLQDDGRFADGNAMSEALGDHLVISRLPAGDVAQGSIVAYRPETAFDVQDVMTLEQAAMVSALLVSKEAAIAGVTRRFQSNALHGLLVGPRSDLSNAIGHADSLRWDLQRPLRVLVAKPVGDLSMHDREAALALWEFEVRGRDDLAATGTLGHAFVAICDAGAADGTLAKVLVDRLSRYAGVGVLIGVSGVAATPTELSSAWNHAQTAADLAGRVKDPSGFRLYEDLGLLKMVNAIDDRSEIDQYLDQVLGPVLRLPDRGGAEMLETLKSLLANNFNVAETARDMHYHYNTLRYRVRKLESLLGPFTQDSRLAMRIGVALEILPLGSEPGSGSTPVGRTT